MGAASQICYRRGVVLNLLQPLKKKQLVLQGGEEGGGPQREHPGRLVNILGSLANWGRSWEGKVVWGERREKLRECGGRK